MTTFLADALWLALLLAALWAAGDLLVRRWGARCPAAARELPATLALGMGLWSLLLFWLAATRLLLRPLLVALVLLAAVWGIWRAVGYLVRYRPAKGVWTPGVWLAVVPAAIAAIAIFELASFPTHGWDDAVYHLRLPAFYLERQGFASPRFSIFAHWPQGLEMLYALALAARGAALAKLLHGACGALLGIATYRLARRAAPPLGAMGAALLVAASPMVIEEARVAYVDLAVALFFLLAFGALFRAGESAEPRRHLLLAGIFLGLATSVKLTAWVGVLALFALWSVRTARRGAWRREALQAAAALWLPALALALPWHLKAWLETGNPVYPLLYGIFDGADWSAALAARAAAWQRDIGMGRSALDYLLLPLRVFVLGAKGYERFNGALGAHWPAVAAFALWAGWRERLVRWALATSGIYFALWAVGPQQARFLLPLLALVAVAGAAAAADLARRPRWRRSLVAFGLLAAALAVVHLVGPLQDAWRQLELRRRFGADLESRLVPPAWRFLERQTPPAARVLFLNNNRVYPLTREAVADSAFEASQIAEWLRPLPSAAAVEAALREEGVTHVLVEDVDWGIDWPRPLLDLLADPARSVLVFESPERRYFVYALRAR